MQQRSKTSKQCWSSSCRAKAASTSNGTALSLENQTGGTRLGNLLDPLVVAREHDALTGPLRLDVRRPSLVGEVNVQRVAWAEAALWLRARDGPSLRGLALLASLGAVRGAGARDDEDVAVLRDPPLAARELGVLIPAAPPRAPRLCGLAAEQRRGRGRGRKDAGEGLAALLHWPLRGRDRRQEGGGRPARRCQQQRHRQDWPPAAAGGGRTLGPGRHGCSRPCGRWNNA
mmetsp:Transcript_125069/g.365287  ORF Transcript_125069/g.365287 Transcript_125069/m.365287 type:complete len:230 (+) Transcript_125069:115-804(+)